MLGDRLDADPGPRDIPMIEEARALAAAGTLPGGSVRNREAAISPVDPGVRPGDRTAILYDAQTSGGLLMAVPPRKTGVASGGEGRWAPEGDRCGRTGWTKEAEGEGDQDMTEVNVIEMRFPEGAGRADDRACLRGRPTRPAGCSPTTDGAVVKVFRMSNAAGARCAYALDPQEQFAAYKKLEELGWDLGGVFHSHTRTEAYPSPTDVRRAQRGRPLRIVSLATGRRRSIRAFRIVKENSYGWRIEEPGRGRRPGRMPVAVLRLNVEESTLPFTRRQCGRTSEVKIPTVFRRFTGKEAEVELAPGTIAELDRPARRAVSRVRGPDHWRGRELHRFVNVYLNDEDVRYLEQAGDRGVRGRHVSPPAVGRRGLTPLGEVQIDPRYDRKHPLVEVPLLRPGDSVRLWVKLEGQNPTGSVKDRIALAMVEAGKRPES